jgi:hypothetical protein
MLPSPNPAVVYKPVSDGAVLLHVQNEVYFGLNAVGARIWELLPPASPSLEVICSAIAAEYPDAPVEQIRADVQELLDDLLEQGLVLAAAAAQAADQDVAVSAP